MASSRPDLDVLTGHIVALAEINSGSFNPDGVDACGERLAELVATLAPDEIGTIDVDPTPQVDTSGAVVHRPVGRALRAAKRADAPFQILVFGHLDTVFGPDDPFQSVTVDGTMLHGPGVADCKGGLVLAIETLRQLESGDPVTGRSPVNDVGWQFIAVPDEEVGSIGSKPLLAEAAAGADLGLGIEPALPSGGVAAARKGSLTVHAVVSGVAAHVGRAHGDGRSAILALARFIDEVEANNERDGVTVNCGKITGGGALNAVPDRAVGSFNLRVESSEDQRWIEDRFAVAAAEPDREIELIWTSRRPPKVRTPELERVLADVTEAAAELGLTVEPEDTGGCCDGNDLAAAGLINVDSLGIAGGGIHSPGEFADVASIPPRAATVVEVVRRARDRSLRPS
ncbi:MAG: M20/M25/M40 family metallo-hydrolase [Actinomycetota bacterium]